MDATEACVFNCPILLCWISH